MTRHGFLWRAYFYTTDEHPRGLRNAGYFKFVRAWTRRGALRLARRHRHRHWAVAVERRRG